MGTMIRCVPRYGFEDTEVREIELELPRGAEEDEIRFALDEWFVLQGIDQAVYDIEVDDDGFFAVVNDEAFAQPWGTRLF